MEPTRMSSREKTAVPQRTHRSSCRSVASGLNIPWYQSLPEFWEKLEQEYSMPKVEKDEQFAFEPVDRMIADNRWICPIKPMFEMCIRDRRTALAWWTIGRGN